MSEEEKLLAMFKAVHGEMSGSCKAVTIIVDNDWEDGETRVEVVKNGDMCWSRSKLDILFDYMTLGW